MASATKGTPGVGGAWSHWFSFRPWSWWVNVGNLFLLGHEILGVFGGCFRISGIAVAELGKLFLVSLLIGLVPQNFRLGQFERRQGTETCGLGQSFSGRMFRGGGQDGRARVNLRAVGDGFGGHRIEIVGTARDNLRSAPILDLRAGSSLSFNLTYRGLPFREFGS